MREKNKVNTQIRLPAEIYEYISAEADKLGIAKNAFLIILLAEGRKLWDATITPDPPE